LRRKENDSPAGQGSLLLFFVRSIAAPIRSLRMSAVPPSDRGALRRGVPYGVRDEKTGVGGNVGRVR